MQELLAESVRFVGWLVLKAATLGRCRGSDSSSVLLEGAVGLSVMAVLMWAGFACWPA
jgi:hypothetical protein